MMGAGLACYGQIPEEEKLVSDSSCEGVNFETAGYFVRDKGSRVVNPFNFLPWVRARERNAAADIAALVDGKRFKYSDAVTGARQIIDREDFLPDSSEARIRLRVEFVSVENCSDLKLNLVYRIYSTQVFPVLSGAPEAREIERRSPADAAGLAKDVDVPSVRPIRFTPLAGYDSTNKLAAGGRLEISKRMGRLPFGSFIVEGLGSPEMHSVSVAFNGSSDSGGWLAHSEWSLSLNNYSFATGAGNLKGGHLSAKLSGTTKPLADGNLMLRFGGQLEGGHRQSALRNVRLSPDTIPSDAFGVLKLYAGLSSRLRRNVFSASYGMELGAVGASARIGWHKHIGDARHEFWYTFDEHRMLSLESRLTAGRLYVPGKIPLGERFFGGNNERPFISGDSWEIRAQPVIRAIPASRFYRTAAGDGASSFLSYNLTAAFAVWRSPLVPQEITRDTEFNELLEGQITNATSIQQLNYATKDPHYIAALEQVKQKHVQNALADMKTAVASAQAARPEQFPEQFKACLGAVKVANSRAEKATGGKGPQQYGRVAALLSINPEEDRLARVNKACVEELNNNLGGDAAIASAGVRLRSVHRIMEDEFGRIDQSTATKDAEADMRFTRRTLNTLFNEVNTFAVSPVFVFDVARIGPASAGLGGVRYGPGAGLRLELASTVHFTTGYAWNVRQRPGEGAGNIFFSLGMRDLFR
jgi:hypothetical protein